MNVNTKLVVWMGLGLVGGAAWGWLTNEPRMTVANPPLEGLEEAVVDQARDGEAAQEAGSGTGAFPGGAAGERFDQLDLERQKDILTRIAQRLAGGSSTGLQLGVARMVSGLSVSQAAALLEALPKEEREQNRGRGGGDMGPSFIRWALAQKLASADPGYSLELGKKLKDELLLGGAAAVIAQKSGAEALRIVASLPEEERGKVLAAMDGAGMEKVGGSTKEMLEVLREIKGALGGSGLGRGGMTVTRMMGASLAETALVNPAAAIEQFQEVNAFLAEELASAEDAKNGRGRGGGRRGGGNMGSPGGWLLQNALSQMRVVSPEAASAFFDSVDSSVRSPWMFTDEAISRFQRAGVDAAVSFAEAQSDPETLRSAALGTWWILAQRDREGAVKWIESLPEGAFRQGVLTAVMVDAWNESRTWGSSQAAIEAGEKLASRSSQLDYYTTLMADRPERSYSQRRANSEVIASLPVSEAERQELQRRLAPIKAP